MISTSKNLRHNSKHNFVVAYKHATSLWGEFNFMKVVHMNVRTLNTYTIMELILLITISDAKNGK